VGRSSLLAKLFPVCEAALVQILNLLTPNVKDHHHFPSGIFQFIGEELTYKTTFTLITELRKSCDEDEDYRISSNLIQTHRG
jgi:hypothetical protein